MDISFGTDGWRGVIGEDFNFENVRSVARAVSRFYQEKKNRQAGNQKMIVIGYDTRFLGEEAALEAAGCFAADGIQPVVTRSPVPTPCISFQVKHRGLVGGLMITASHNPSIYNGIKFKAHYGGTADTGMYEGIERQLQKTTRDEMRKRKNILREDFTDPYLEYVRDTVDSDAIGEHGWQIVWDAMHGATGQLFSQIHKGGNLYVKTIRSYPDPRFGGVQPEPIPRNLHVLKEELKMGQWDLGVAADGDGDRLGVVLPGGKYVTPQEVFALIALHLLEVKGARGGVARTFSSSLYLDRIASHFEVPLYETGIGFKYLCPHLEEGDVVIAGEESGGLAIRGALPERDALVTASLLLETLTRRGLSLSQAVHDLQNRFGPLVYRREDVAVENMEKIEKNIRGWVREPPPHMAGRKITRVVEKDGMKLSFGEDGWLLVRKSGTEPLVRLYCELPSKEAVSMTLREARAWISRG